MRKQLSTALIALLTFMSSAFADNEIYIDQTGSSATININIIIKYVTRTYLIDVHGC